MGVQASNTTSGVDSRFARDALTLMGGQGVAQILSLVVMLLLARLFTPEAFGMAAVFQSLLAVIASVSCLRLELAVMLPKSDDDSANILLSSMLIGFVFTAASVVAVVAGGHRIAELLNIEAIAPYLWLLPATVLARSLTLILQSWNSRYTRYALLARTTVVSTVVSLAVKVILGFGGWTTGGVVVGDNVRWIAKALTLALGTRRADQGREFNISWQGMLAQMRRWYRFPLLSSWSGLLNVLAAQVSVMALSAAYGGSIVGYYSNGVRMLLIPMSLVGGALGQVFFQRAAVRRSTSQPLGNMLEEVVQRLIIFGTLPVLAFAAFSPHLFELMLGQEWVHAGELFRVFSVSLGIRFAIAYLPLFSVFEMQAAGLVANGAAFLAGMLPYLLGRILHLPVMYALVGHSALDSLVWLVVLVFFIHRTGASTRRILKGVTQGLIWLVPGTVAVLLMDLVVGAPRFVTAIMGICMFICYYWALGRQDKNLREMFSRQRGSGNRAKPEG